jgi:uncharacterized protein (DUF2252 family)
MQTLNNESLCNVGKVQIVIELGGSADLAGFDSSMIGGYIVDIVRLLAVVKEEL